MGQATTDDIARIAREAGERGDAGYGWYGQWFNLTKTGYCTRFVRQVHEEALGLAPRKWEFSSPHARALEAKLIAAGKRVTKPGPGDIVCINGGTGRFGHVGIYLGGGGFAENTGSSRGPGTTISKLVDVVDRITGFYRAVPLAAREFIDEELEVVLLPGSEPIDCTPALEGGITRVDLRPLAEALGYDIFNHITDQVKVYIRKREED